MVRVKAKKAKGDNAFTKKKQKVGAKKLAPATETRAEVHARTLQIKRGRNTDADDVSGARPLRTLSDCVGDCNHYRPQTRASAFRTMLRYLTTAATNAGATVATAATAATATAHDVTPVLHLELVRLAAERQTDGDGDVRAAALEVLLLLLRRRGGGASSSSSGPSAPTSSGSRAAAAAGTTGPAAAACVIPHSMLRTYAILALTHADRGVRRDALRFLEGLLDCAGSDFLAADGGGGGATKSGDGSSGGSSAADACREAEAIASHAVANTQRHGRAADPQPTRMLRKLLLRLLPLPAPTPPTDAAAGDSGALGLDESDPCAAAATLGSVPSAALPPTLLSDAAIESLAEALYGTWQLQFRELMEMRWSLLRSSDSLARAGDIAAAVAAVACRVASLASVASDRSARRRHQTFLGGFLQAVPFTVVELFRSNNNNNNNNSKAVVAAPAAGRNAPAGSAGAGGTAARALAVAVAGAVLPLTPHSAEALKFVADVLAAALAPPSSGGADGSVGGGAADAVAAAAARVAWRFATQHRTTLAAEAARATAATVGALPPPSTTVAASDTAVAKLVPLLAASVEADAANAASSSASDAAAEAAESPFLPALAAALGCLRGPCDGAVARVAAAASAVSAASAASSRRKRSAADAALAAVCDGRLPLSLCKALFLLRRAEPAARRWRAASAVLRLLLGLLATRHPAVRRVGIADSNASLSLHRTDEEEAEKDANNAASGSDSDGGSDEEEGGGDSTEEGAAAAAAVGGTSQAAQQRRDQLPALLAALAAPGSDTADALFEGGGAGLRAVAAAAVFYAALEATPEAATAAMASAVATARPIAWLESL